MPPFDHVSRPTVSTESINASPERTTELPAQKEHLSHAKDLNTAVKILFPGTPVTEIAKKLDAYLKTLPSDGPNRETKRELVKWASELRGRKLKKNLGTASQDIENISYLCELAKFEEDNRTYQRAEHAYAQAHHDYELAQEKNSVDLSTWKTQMRKYQDAPIETLMQTPTRVIFSEIRHETIESKHAPTSTYRDEGPHYRPGLVEAKTTETAWKKMYVEALNVLRQQFSDPIPKNDQRSSESFMTRMGRGAPAIQAFMAMIMTVMVLHREQDREVTDARNGEEARTEQVASSTRQSAVEQKFSPAQQAIGRAKELAHAQLEQAGPHEVSITLGNGQGDVERYVVGSRNIDGRVGFENGTHYLSVNRRQGEQARLEAQADQLVNQALRPYQEHGVHADAPAAVIEHITIHLTASASLEGNTAGNTRLAALRSQEVEGELQRALAAHGLSADQLTFIHENRGAQGDLNLIVSGLEQMGVHVNPHHTHRFVNEMMSLERTRGIEGVQIFLAQHHGSADRATIEDFLETHFHAQRAVGVEMHVAHRALSIHNDAPGHAPESQTPPTLKKHLERNYLDANNPQTEEVQPPGQTSKQPYQYRRTTTVPSVRIEPGISPVHPTPPEKPTLTRPELPTPPIPPVLPRLSFKRTEFPPKKPNTGAKRIRQPFVKSGKTFRIDQGSL